MWSWTGPTPSYIGNYTCVDFASGLVNCLHRNIYIEEQILSLYLGCNVKMCGKIIVSQSLELLLRWAIKNISIYDFWRVFFYFKWSYYKWDHIYITKIHSKLEIWYLFCSSLVYINNTNGLFVQLKSRPLCCMYGPLKNIFLFLVRWRLGYLPREFLKKVISLKILNNRNVLKPTVKKGYFIKRY